MYNQYTKNFRNYPSRPRQDIIIHKPIPLPAPDYSAINTIANDGWESEEKIIINPDMDDENDFGGLPKITTEINAKKALDRWEASLSNKDAKYFSSVFSTDIEKFKWVVPGVLAGGPHPFYFAFENNLTAYKEAGFKAIVSVYDEPLEISKVSGFQYYFLPTEDGKICSLEATCKFIDAMEKINKPVFVHSFAGNERTGTILAAYFMYKNWLTADEAISHVRLSYNKYAIGTTEQEDALHRFALDL